MFYIFFNQELFAFILGENPANVQTHLRFGLHWHVNVETKRIIEGYGIFDLPGFFIQAGIDLFARAHQKQKAYSEPHPKTVIRQGLLKLLWTVYTEGKLQSCLKLRNFQNPYNKDKSVYLYDIPCTKKA